jgi:hypothetical protein
MSIRMVLTPAKSTVVVVRSMFGFRASMPSGMASSDGWAGSAAPQPAAIKPTAATDINANVRMLDAIGAPSLRYMTGLRIRGIPQAYRSEGRAGSAIP